MTRRSRVGRWLRHALYNRLRVQQLAFAWLATGLFAASLGYFLYAYLFTFGVIRSSSSRRRLAPGTRSTSCCSPSSLSTTASLRVQRIKRAVTRPRSAGASSGRCTRLMASVLFLLVCAFWQPVPGRSLCTLRALAVVGYGAQVAGLVLTVAASRALDVLDLSGLRQVLNARPRRRHGAACARDRVASTAGAPSALFRLGALRLRRSRHDADALQLRRYQHGLLAVAIPFEESGLIRRSGRTTKPISVKSGGACFLACIRARRRLAQRANSPTGICNRSAQAPLRSPDSRGVRRCPVSSKRWLKLPSLRHYRPNCRSCRCAARSCCR